MLTIALYILCIIAAWLLLTAMMAVLLCIFLKACALADAADHAAHDQSDGLEAINATDTHGGVNAATRQ